MLETIDFSKYRNIVVVSDYTSEYISGVLFDYIYNTLLKTSTDKLDIYRCDGFDDTNSDFNNLRNNIDKILLYRILSYINMSNYQLNIPRKVIYGSDLLLVVKDKKLNISKDRYGDPNRIRDLDLNRYTIRSKIKRILNKINDK